MYSKPLLIQKLEWLRDYSKFIFIYTEGIDNKQNSQKMFKIPELFLRTFILEIPIYKQ